MAGAAETSPYWIPLVLGGLGAAGSALSAGAEGKLGGYGSAAGPPTLGDISGTLLGNQQDRLNQMMGIYAGRAQQPVTMPGAVVQPVGGLAGGSLPFRLGPTAMDPALYRGELLGRPGHNLGDGTIPITQQPTPAMPQAGLGQSELMSALELMGVTQDPMGNLMSGGQGMFTGAQGPLGGLMGRGGDQDSLINQQRPRPGQPFPPGTLGSDPSIPNPEGTPRYPSPPPFPGGQAP